MQTFTEQDRHRKALALILCLFLGLLYFETIWRPYFQGPTGRPSASQPATTATTGASNPGQQAAQTQANTGGGVQGIAGQSTGQLTAPDNATFGQLSANPADAELAASGIISVESETLGLDISLLGGRVSAARLNKYFRDQEHLSEKLDLVKHVEQTPLPLGVYSGSANDARTLYRVVSAPTLISTDSKQTLTLAAESSPAEIVLEGELADGRTVRKLLRFYPDGYLFDVEVVLSAPAADGTRAALEWTQFTEDTDTSMLDPYNVKGYTWFDGEKAQRVNFADFVQPSQALAKTQWVAIVEKYFATTLLAKDQARLGELRRDKKSFATRLTGDERQVALSVFVGPKSYEMLDGIGFELERLIDFGWSGFVAAPLLSLLHAVFGLVGNYGLAIVVLTIMVRLVLYPLNVTQFKQMKVMQDLKPEIDRIKERVEDKQEQQRQLMELYSKRGANPLGGCLPLVLQMPIFIGLYSALILAVELRGADFALWINDLSAPEKLMVGDVGIPVMVILFVLSMIGQQMTTPTAMDPTQKKVMMVMPVVMGFMFVSFPAGLTLYWLTSNLISIGQQKALHRDETSARSALTITLGVSAAVFALVFIITLF